MTSLKVNQFYHNAAIFLNSKSSIAIEYLSLITRYRCVCKEDYKSQNDSRHVHFHPREDEKTTHWLKYQACFSTWFQITAIFHRY